MQSSVLSAFWGQPIAIDAYVLLPDSFYKQPAKQYPIIYWVEGFDGDGRIDPQEQLQWQQAMRKLDREFIVVSLSGMFNGGHHEFADSANNGPWGAALTTEFIPQTEAHFRAIGSRETRFVGGVSSGGWSALWLQVTYPDLFGGEWSFAPDPVDFRDFTGPDLSRQPPQNFFTDVGGHGYDLGEEALRAFVTGPGWEHRQFDSFDAVFSPRGADGKPEQLFNRQTGEIDPLVQSYWEAHYDIARILRDRWPVLGPKLRHKIHIAVGAADEYHLDRSVRLFQKELDQLGSDAEINIVPGVTHIAIHTWDGNMMSHVVSGASALLP